MYERVSTGFFMNVKGQKGIVQLQVSEHEVCPPHLDASRDLCCFLLSSVLIKQTICLSILSASDDISLKYSVHTGHGPALFSPSFACCQPPDYSRYQYNPLGPCTSVLLSVWEAGRVKEEIIAGCEDFWLVCTCRHNISGSQQLSTTHQWHQRL